MAGLVQRYQEPHRRYHNLAHLQRMLDLVAALSRRPADEQAVRIAVWFHDAVYDPTRADNEQRSADLAEQALRQVGGSQPLTAEVVRLVLLTADHDADVGDPAGAALCDADLAILASRPVDYDAYAAAVRQEYAHLPDERFAAGRHAVLNSLLGRRQIFVTEPGRLRLESPARANLERELAGLAATGSRG